MKLSHHQLAQVQAGFLMTPFRLLHEKGACERKKGPQLYYSEPDATQDAGSSSRTESEILEAALFLSILPGNFQIWNFILEILNCTESASTKGLFC